MTGSSESAPASSASDSSSPSGFRASLGTAWMIAAGLALATLLLYAPVRRFDFIRYDDPRYVLLNPHVARGLDGANVAWALTAYEAGNWHPLTLISHMADVSLFGMSPGPQHLVNVAIHALCAALLFVFWNEATHRALPALFVAALFAIHPLNVESVAWISQRKSVLCMAFILAALLAYLAWTRRGGGVRYALALLACACALAAKPMAVVMPALLLLLDYWPLARAEGCGGSRRLRQLILEKVPFGVLAAAASVVTWLAQSRGGAVGSLEDHPAGSRLAQAAFAYGWYLLRMVWPVRLSLFYPTSLAGAGPQIGLSVLALVALTVVVVRTRRSRPYLAFGWGWYAIALLPVSGLVAFGTQIVADRYAYLALIGPFVALSFVGADVASARSSTLRWAMGGAAFVVILALAFGAGLALAPWRDSLSILSRGYERAPDNVHAAANLGLELVKLERYDEAIPLLSRVAAERPRYTTVQLYLGHAYARSGRLADAKAAYEAALNLDPSDPRPATGLARVLAALHDDAGAERRLRQAIEADPGFAEAWQALGEVLSRQGKTEESAAALARARDLSRGLPGRNAP